MTETMTQATQMRQMSQAQLLHFIDVVSFQVIDTQLFLDSHPTDEEAIQYFNYFADLRRQGLSTYAQMYSPLTIDTAMPCESWDWATSPWPWEGGTC